MRLFNYGVVLRSLQSADLEMVRNWRNSPHVRENMEFQEIISPAAQAAWFATLDQAGNRYFVIEWQDQPMGVVHLKNIDWEMRAGEAGIFVGEKEMLGEVQAVFAVLALMDLAFSTLRFSGLRAKVSQGNRRVLDFNRALGYRVLPGQEGSAFLQLEVEAEAYFQQAKRLRTFSRKYAGERVPYLEFAAGEDFWEAKCRGGLFP